MSLNNPNTIENTYIEAIVDEISEDSILHYVHDNELLFIVEPVKGSNRLSKCNILQILRDIHGGLHYRVIREVRDHLEAIRTMARFSANSRINLQLQMNVINK